MFASQWIDIDAAAMFWSIVKIVIIPIGLGFVVQSLLGERVKAGVQVLPLVSGVAIVAIVAAVVALNQKKYRYIRSTDFLGRDFAQWLRTVVGLFNCQSL